jgi:transmembrane sensor
MGDPAVQRSRAQEEAASWFARRSRLSVTTDELRDFRDWQKQNGNAAAYAQIEAAWATTGTLSGDPHIQAALIQTLARRPPRTRRAAAVGGLPRGALFATGVLVLVASGALFVFLRPPPSYNTALGEQSQVTLDDGSRVHLNTDSKLVIRFHRGERDVELARGEAFFEVAHDAKRPFIVQADGARVRAIGTKFSVRRDASGVQVTLLEGQVRVARADASASAVLNANQQLTVSATGLSKPKSTDAAGETAWTSGRLTFHATPLAEAVAEVNRYTTHKVTLDLAASAAQQPITGVFDTGDTDAFVNSVAVALDLQASKAPDGSTRLGPHSGTPAA